MHERRKVAAQFQAVLAAPFLRIQRDRIDQRTQRFRRCRHCVRVGQSLFQQFNPTTIDSGQICVQVGHWLRRRFALLFRHDLVLLRFKLAQIFNEASAPANLLDRIQDRLDLPGDLGLFSSQTRPSCSLFAVRCIHLGDIALNETLNQFGRVTSVDVVEIIDGLR
ncbi:hypothetical protein [Acidiphilium sp. C61]|uniref:hypothetical protein n=1 Tax=Acidiphilium sp. C61 TaxID=1671485 RepID=UPI00157B75FF|nr:hypothetical protein [Acidiphilium sp. C61]